MVQRRALLVAPDYDGHVLVPLQGGKHFLDECAKLLKERGGYETKTLGGPVPQGQLRERLETFFDIDGELLFYFYGHGVLRPPGVGVLATSDAARGNEGVPISEVLHWSQKSDAREVVVILDCCHAGATDGGLSALPRNTVDFEANMVSDGVKGRAFLAACCGHQQGREEPDERGRLLGAFTRRILSGLGGDACLRGHSQVRASSLGTYVTQNALAWGQSPIVKYSEGVERQCVLIHGETQQPALAAPKPSQDLGHQPEVSDGTTIEALTKLLEVDEQLARAMGEIPKERRSLRGRALASAILEPGSLRQVADPFMLGMEHLKAREGRSKLADPLLVVFQRAMIDVGASLAERLPGGSEELYKLDVGDSAVLEPEMAAAADRLRLSYWMVGGKRRSTYEVGGGERGKRAIEMGMVSGERVVRVAASVAARLATVRAKKGLSRSSEGSASLSPHEAKTVERLLTEIRGKLLQGHDIAQKSEYFTVIHDAGEPRMQVFAEMLARKVPQLRVVYSLRYESNEEEIAFVDILDNIYNDHNTIMSRNG